MITGKNSEHKISVVFIIGHLSHGGAEKQLFILTKGIDKNKFNPVVLCLSKESHPWGDRIIESGVKIVYIPRLSRFDVTRILRLAWFFYKYNADIIISSLHIGNVYSWLAGLLYFSKSRYIAQVRSKENQMSGMVRWLNVRAFNSADVIITNSKLLNSFVEKFFKQNSSKIVTINNGIKIQKSKKLKNDIGVIHIGTIGKDTQAKNIDLFIDFALKLLTNQENICFHLCGRGLENSSRLFKRIPGKYRTLFNFHGEVNNPNSIYQMLDIYVSTSFSEGSPNTILEAMSLGLPVIATDVGGVKELIQDNITGFLVQSSDLDGLVKYCRMLIDNSNLRCKFGQEGQKYISKNYSSEKMVREFEKIFNSLGVNPNG